MIRDKNVWGNDKISVILYNISFSKAFVVRLAKSYLYELIISTALFISLASLELVSNSAILVSLILLPKAFISSDKDVFKFRIFSSILSTASSVASFNKSVCSFIKSLYSFLILLSFSNWSAVNLASNTFLPATSKAFLFSCKDFLAATNLVLIAALLAIISEAFVIDKSALRTFTELPCLLIWGISMDNLSISKSDPDWATISKGGIIMEPADVGKNSFTIKCTMELWPCTGIRTPAKVTSSMLPSCFLQVSSCIKSFSLSKDFFSLYITFSLPVSMSVSTFSTTPTFWPSL